jgi:hypothetical protein
VRGGFVRKALPRRTHELTEAARLLQRFGWIVEKVALEVAEEEGELVPKGCLIVRYEPPRSLAVL